VGLSESLALQQALIVIGDAIAAADRGIGVRASLALRVVDEAGSLLLELDALALKNALVVVGLAVDSADRGVVARAVNTVVFIWAFAAALESNAAALSLALVEVGEAVGSAFGLVDLGAVIAVREVDVAEAVVALPDSLAVHQALIVISDAVSSADWNVRKSLRASALRQYSREQNRTDRKRFYQDVRHDYSFPLFKLWRDS
jgi:hypothetical protein